MKEAWKESDDLEDIKTKGVCEDCGKYLPIITASEMCSNRSHRFCKKCFVNWVELVDFQAAANARRINWNGPFLPGELE